MQLVELQESTPHGEIAVMALTYDSVDVLAGFSATHGITYPLLADVGSVVIERLGLLNTEIERDQAYWGMGFGERHQGLPFPGTFVLDADGVVESKHFERSHRNRASTAVLIGRELSDLGEVAVSETAAGVRLIADVASERVYPNQVSVIRVRLEIEDGLHVYVPPIEDGYTALDVSVEAPDGFYWDQPALPGGSPYRVEGLDEQFHVVEGDVILSIPFHVHESLAEVTPEVVVSYQTCTESLCNPPVSVRLALPLSVRPKI